MWNSMTSDINYKLPKEKKAFRLTEESKEKAWSVNFSKQMNILIYATRRKMIQSIMKMAGFGFGLFVLNVNASN